MGRFYLPLLPCYAQAEMTLLSLLEWTAPDYTYAIRYYTMTISTVNIALTPNNRQSMQPPEAASMSKTFTLADFIDLWMYVIEVIMIMAIITTSLFVFEDPVKAHEYLVILGYEFYNVFAGIDQPAGPAILGG